MSFVNNWKHFFFGTVKKKLVFDYSGIQAVSYIIKKETKMIKDQP